MSRPFWVDGTIGIGEGKLETSRRVSAQRETDSGREIGFVKGIISKDGDKGCVRRYQYR